MGKDEETEIGAVEGNRVGSGSYVRGHQMRRRFTVVPRSCSMGMGRIDEDGPCEFGEDTADKAAVNEDDDVTAGKAAEETADLYDGERLCGSGEADAEEEADSADEGVAEAAGGVDLDRDGEGVATEEV
ncbi:hypothetical protein RHGRI_037675 [Rhododendron griersonianum]|uniref:Uncharacterized protein n=1 Tax=Rhododendron griersonianum TaxID=479676 RepID=A0AAV6HVD6_9ERIC|nr:hypothetical protein RHGRI_037675 [Rhododendron griersonianum]